MALGGIDVLASDAVMSSVSDKTRSLPLEQSPMMK